MISPTPGHCPQVVPLVGRVLVECAPRNSKSAHALTQSTQADMLVLGVGAGAAVVITDRAELAELIELNIARNLPGNTGRLADGPHEVLFPPKK